MIEKYPNLEMDILDMTVIVTLACGNMKQKNTVKTKPKLIN
jgi:hypothetical protein